MEMTDDLQAQIDRYHWYHSIEVAPGVWTRGYEEFRPLQAPVLEALADLPVQGRRILDVGCRDGLFSLAAERAGASEVIAFDNDLSRGAVEVVLPHLGSRVQMHALNLYELLPETFGSFDGVIFAGVLYHLRYPMWGLKRIRDVMNPGAWLLIETAVFTGYPGGNSYPTGTDASGQAWSDLPLLYCPIEAESPYEPTSVSFFNVKGLTDTLSSMGIIVESVKQTGAASLIPGDVKAQTGVVRATFTCRFEAEAVHPTQKTYWEDRHSIHRDWSHEEATRVIREKSPELYRAERQYR